MAKRTRFIGAFRIVGDGWVLQEEKGTACLWKKTFNTTIGPRVGYIVTQSDIKYIPGVNIGIFGDTPMCPKFLVDRNLPKDGNLAVCDNPKGAWETWNILCEADTKCEGY